MATSDRTAAADELAVVLLQLGGPRSLDEVQPFLESMFRDPDLFDLPVPSPLRDALARKLSAWRTRKSRPLYAAIGGKSPIVGHTRKQARLLERRLRLALPCRVHFAMRYGAPSTKATVDLVRASGCKRVLLLPLYPQYSAATTGSSIREWERCCRRCGFEVPTERIRSYFRHPKYIGVVARRIEEALTRFPPGSRPHLVFSAHGLPRKFIRQGDPYQAQIEGTVRLAVREASWAGQHALCYQSRIGPQRWLKPTLTDTLRRLGESGEDSVLVVPISFVSDHLETLSEIDIEAREQASRWGIARFETAEGLNASREFIDALAELVLQRSAPEVAG